MGSKQAKTRYGPQLFIMRQYTHTTFNTLGSTHTNTVSSFFSKLSESESTRVTERGGSAGASIQSCDL